MISQYKNSSKLLSANNAVAAERFSFNEQQLFSYLKEQYTEVPDISTDAAYLELHVYSADKWITGEHRIQQFAVAKDRIDPVTNKQISLSAAIGINLKTELDKLKIVTGNYKFAINFFRNLISRKEKPFLDDRPFLQEASNETNGEKFHFGGKFNKTLRKTFFHGKGEKFRIQL